MRPRPRDRTQALSVGQQRGWEGGAGEPPAPGQIHMAFGAGFPITPSANI